MSGPWTLVEGPAGMLRTYATPHPVTDASRAAVVLCHDLPVTPGGSQDVGRSYPLLADRLAIEAGRRAWTATLRGAGGSEGDFSAAGWLEDLGVVVGLASSEGARVWLAGFGLGAALCLRHAVSDPRVLGVAAVGSSPALTEAERDPKGLLEECRLTGVVGSSAFSEDPEAWAAPLLGLAPLSAAADLRRPLLIVHGTADHDEGPFSPRGLAEAAGRFAELRLVYGAGRRLRSDPRVVASLVGWIERQP